MASRLQPHDDGTVMGMADLHWRRLRGIAIAFGGLNLVSYLLCDTREWWVYFDPFWICTLIVPTFVLGLPIVVFLCKPVNSHESTTAWFAVVATTLLMFELFWVTQILVATFCRDEFFSFFWPWEERGFKLRALNSINLSDWFWIGQLDQQMPARSFVRELPGIALVTIHLLVLPVVVAGSLSRRFGHAVFFRGLFGLMVFQILSGLVLKVVLRWTMNWKYLVAFPEVFFNI